MKTKTNNTINNEHRINNRILIYFLLTLGVIAIFLWSVFLIQILKQEEISLNNQNKINELLFVMSNESKINLDLVQYQQGVLEKFNQTLSGQKLMTKNILEILNMVSENRILHNHIAKHAKNASELNVNLTKINAKNIENIINNISEIKQMIQ